MRYSSTGKITEIAMVIGILLLSLALRWRYMELNPMLKRDSSLYCNAATLWSQTGDFESAYEDVGGTAPLYIYLLKIGIDAGIPVISWGRFLAFFFSGAFVLGFYFLGKQLFDGNRIDALICMLLAGVHPVIGRVSVGLLREGPFLALAVFALVAFVRALKTGSSSAAFCCGLLLGAAMLTRHEAAELLLWGVLVLLPWRYRTNADTDPEPQVFLRRLRQPLLMLAGGLAAVVVILIMVGIPPSFLTHQYLSKLNKVRL